MRKEVVTHRRKAGLDRRTVKREEGEVNQGKILSYGLTVMASSKAQKREHKKRGRRGGEKGILKKREYRDSAQRKNDMLKR